MKFGPTVDSSGGTFGWELIEPVKRVNGPTLPFKTNWASAYVTSTYSDGVTLEMKMLDFRIMWQDDARVNGKPRDQATAKISF